MKTITPELLQKFSANYAKRPDLKILSNALSDTTITEAAFVPLNAAKLRMDFSITTPATGVTNQKQSGRCWMFASMNLARERVIKKCNLEEFSLSGTYLAFYDKLEKANQFFEAILAYSEEPIDSRANRAIISGCCADGGQWDMFVALMKKYGCVPSWVQPETIHSVGTAEWRDQLTEQLAEYGLELRALKAAGKDTDARREEMLAQYYNTLCILYGEPVTEFDFEYTGKDEKFHIDRHLTPKAFFDKYIGDDLDDYVGIISSPVHEFGKTYDQPFMGDVVEASYKWLNLPIEELEAMTVEMLKSGEGVMFSCDCHPYRHRARGFWDQDTMDYRSVLGGLTLGMDKKDRMLTGVSAMNHCMYFCGVNLDEDGKPDRWKIENSWGDQSGQEGFFVCSEKWFKEYVMQVFVRRSFLNEAQLALLDQDPIHMTFWDPLA